MSRGLSTLIEFNRRHADEELHEYLMTKPDKVLVHNKCRRDYVDEKRFAQQQKRKHDTETDDAQLEAPKLLRSKVGTFSWKTNFRDDRRPRPNWAGFMQEVSSGVHPSVAEFRMLLIIDMTFSDKSCVFSTLTFVIEQQ